MVPQAQSPSMVGTVVAFDPAVGLGTVRGDDGVELGFHCIEIADGTRQIAVGTRVGFGRILKLGRTEAAALTPL